jgi:hypothetical protein
MDAENSLLTVSRSVRSSFSTITAQILDLLDDVSDDIFVHPSQKTIDPDVAVIALRRVPDQSIGPHQAAKPVAVGGTGGHPLGIVNQNPGQFAVPAVKVFQPVKHLLVAEPPLALQHDALGLIEQLGIHDGFKGPVRPDPHLGRIFNPFLFQFERGVVVDVVADVFFVGEHLMNRTACPGSLQVGQNPPVVELLGDLELGQPVANKFLVDLSDDSDLVGGAGDQDHAIGLQAFVLTVARIPFSLPC